MKRMMAASAVLALALSACGGGGGRPSTDEIADALRGEDNPFGALASDNDEAIDCIAEALHDSDLSDEALQAIVDNDEDAEAEDGDEEALTDLQGEITDCAVQGAGG
jgi:hypothetical protein